MKRSAFFIASIVFLASTPSKTESTLGLDVTSASKDGLAMGLSATFYLENSLIQAVRIAGGGLYVRNLGPKNDKYKGYYIDTGIYGKLLPTFHWQLNYTYVGGKLDKLGKGYYKSVETLSFIYKVLDLVDIVAGVNTEKSYFISLSKNIFENSSIFAGWSHNYDTEENKGFVGISIALQSTTKTRTTTKTTKTTKVPQKIPKITKIPHVGNPVGSINVISNLHSKINKEVIKPHYQHQNQQSSSSSSQISSYSSSQSSQSSFYSSSSSESSSSSSEAQSSSEHAFPPSFPEENYSSYKTQSSSEYSAVSSEENIEESSSSEIQSSSEYSSSEESFSSEIQSSSEYSSSEESFSSEIQSSSESSSLPPIPLPPL